METSAQKVIIPGQDSGPSLEGRLYEAGGRGAVMAAPHPLYGGSLYNPVVAEAASALSESGFSTLTFNWRGVGASNGAPSNSPEEATADYSAALELLRARSEPPYIAAGYSFGAVAAVTVALATVDVSRLLLVPPPVYMLAGLELGGLEVPVRVIAGDCDVFAPADGLERLLDSLPDAKLEVVAGADHFFAGGGLADIHALVGAALE